MDRGTEIVPVPPRCDVARAGFDTLPPAIARAGERAGRRFIEFFTANIRNKNTRAAYAHAVTEFFTWCEASRLPNSLVKVSIGPLPGDLLAT